MNYDGAKTTYIGAAVPEVRSQLLVLNGVAKTYAMPGWRIGWMIAPVDVAKAASKLQGHMTSNVNNISSVPPSKPSPAPWTPSTRCAPHSTSAARPSSPR